MQKQCRCLGWISGQRVDAMIEKVARIKGFVAVKIVGAAVDLIGARFDSYVDYDTWFLDKVRLRLFLGVEFLYSIKRQIDGLRSLDSFFVEEHLAAIYIVVIGHVF